MNRNCFVSWSGGKDSCLAFYKAVRAGYSPKKLFTMFSKENDISTAHRLKEEVLRAQALAIGIEHTVGRALFNEYEEVLSTILSSLKKRAWTMGFSAISI